MSHQSSSALNVCEWHTDNTSTLGEIFLSYCGKHRFFELQVGMPLCLVNSYQGQRKGQMEKPLVLTSVLNLFSNATLMLYCLQDPEWEKFEIKILPSVGCSVFTKVPFQKGSRVCRYNGELISKKEMEKREKIYDSNPKFYGSFVLDFSCGAKH